MAKVINFFPEELGAYVPEGSSEMSAREHEFLLWCLSHKRPKKILIVGTASGGTDALILNNTGRGQEIYAVDLNKSWYRDNRKETGWLIPQLCSAETRSRYHPFLGGDIIAFIDEIGTEIDMAILDTVHGLPGELLQYLAIAPNMKLNSLLVLHDTNLNLTTYGKPPSFPFPHAIATKVLFVALQTNEKYLMHPPAINIAAVTIDEHARKSIDNLFFSLTFTWKYFPAELIAKYRERFIRFYSSYCMELFDWAVKRNEMYLST